ncbi:12267_t:CDS:10 [Funneliformis mosseae]|uniref:Transcription initiation factor TFIID subunit 1 n=1 Tax=Funneliformis mosseae TaxID=27381 RepID=A0A9N8V9J0_FUNMO|nr:12267_t:CDS:10 [Funneliformis mosseae]
MSYAGLFFGNFDEEGQLEGAGFDEEVRESLQRVAGETDVLNEIFSVRSLGIDDKEEEDAIKSEVSTQTPVQTPGDSSIKPEEDAIDYSDFNELADETMFSEKYYQQGVNSVINIKRSLSFPPLQLHTTAPLQNLPIMDNESQKVVKQSTEETKSEINIKTLYPAFEKDRILKFSELFATKLTQRKLHQLNIHAEPQSEFKFAKDERELFESSKQFDASAEEKFEESEDIIELVSSSPMTQISGGSMYGSDFEAEVHNDKLFETEKLSWKIPEKNNAYYSIVMDTWEDKILWDSDDEDHASLDMDYISESEESNAIMAYRNTELESGEWINHILWDDYNGPIPFAKLTLDMNDPNLLFDYSALEPPKPMVFDLSGRKIIKYNPPKKPFGLPYKPERRVFQRRLNFGRMYIQHSLPALQLHSQYFKTKFTKSDIRALHRPSIQFPLEQEIHFNKMKKIKKKKLRNREAMKKPKDLTLKDKSDYVLFEYSEEYPPILSNIGMGTLLLNFYRKKDPKDSFLPKLDIGGPVVLDVIDESPFMNFGNVERGQIISALYNNLIRAPLFRHDVNDTDFLIIRNTNKGRSKYFIRELKNLFVVGQTFPMQEVPSPPSRKAKTIANTRIQVAAFRYMKKNRYNLLVQDKLTKKFPDYSLQTLRGRLKEFAEMARKKGNFNNSPIWKLKPSVRLPTEDELRRMLTPEMICLEESMMVGERHLQDAGYKSMWTDEDDKSKAAKKDDDDSVQDDNKLAIEESKLAIEQQLAPWITTRNFLNATQTNAMLKLHGEGDPTGRGEGFSFIRISMKDIFLKAGESAQDKLAEIESKPKSGHKYNVVEQWKRYNQEIYRIWNAQYASLSKHRDPNMDSVKQEVSLDDAGTYSNNQFMKEDDNQIDSDVDYQNMIDSAMPDRDESISPLPNTPAEYDDVTSIDGSISSRANYDFGSHRNRALVINRLVRSSTGEAIWTKTHVTDPAVINAYINQRQIIEEQTTAAELLEPTNDEERNKRLRKRIQDQLAKLRRNQERRQQRKAAREAAKAVAADSTYGLPIKDKKTDTIRRCGNCGQTGHMKTNKKCPRYGMNAIGENPMSPLAESSESAAPTSDSPMIKMEGSKILIRSKAIAEKPPETTRIKITLPSKDEASKRKRKAPDLDSSADRKRPFIDVTSLISNVITTLWDTENAHHFHYPVTAEIAPDYTTVIKKPIALLQMQNKHSRGEYKNIAEFMQDMKLMVNNCRTYNGDSSGYTVIAKNLFAKAEELIREAGF